MANTTNQQSTAVTNSVNPLHRYRSYSYQFVLIACNNTDVIDAMQYNTNQNIFVRPAGQGKRGVINYVDSNNNTIGQYIIVIDTRVDMDFIIEEVNYGTQFTGDITSAHSAAAVSGVITDGEIMIMEPRGVDFLNVLSNLTKQLDTDPIAMPFALKIFFVGNNEDGSVDYITDVLPFAFIPVDIDASVDASGARYKLSICGTTNGVGFTSMYSAVIDGITLQITPGESMSVILSNLTEAINTRYLAERQALITIMNSNNPPVPIDQLAKVTYSVSLNKLAADAPAGAGKIATIRDWGTNKEVQTSNGADGCFIKGTKEGGMPEMIDKIFKSSPKWLAIAIASQEPSGSDFNTQTVEKWGYKLSSKFTKTPTSCRVDFYIDEYIYDAVFVQDDKKYGKEQQPLPPNTQVLTYDYIFTGKNTDIKDMQINLNMALALYQTLSMTKSLVSQGQDVSGGPCPVNIAGNAQATNLSTPINVAGIIHKGTPLFAPMAWLDQYKQAINSVTTASADAIWRNFAGYQSINSNITIAGNPILLGQVSYPILSEPTYLKINIKMPVSQDDIWEYQQSNNQHPGGLYQTFWFDGLYLILSAVNRFKDGEFTQELELISQPETSPTAANNAAKQDALTKQLDVLNDKATEIENTFATSSTAALNEANAGGITALTRLVHQAGPAQKTQMKSSGSQ